MIISRQGEVRENTNRSSSKLLVRANGQVVSANQWFYSFMGANSSMSVVDLIAEEDGVILKAALERISSEGDDAKTYCERLPLEFLTTLDNRLGQFLTNIYLRLNLSERTENGTPLYEIALIDLKEQMEGVDRSWYLLTKYRFFMSLKNELYFEYNRNNDNFVMYKYVGEKSVKFVDMNFSDFVSGTIARYKNQYPDIEEELQKLSSLLVESIGDFDSVIHIPVDEGLEGDTFQIKGGSMITYNNGNVIGILIPDSTDHQMPYYMSAAGLDAGTGILNKRAATEFAIDRLRQVGDGNAWMLVMDIDDFKGINDSYGHMFGDQVIRFIAETLQQEIGYHGVIGRFGGDEYFALLDGRINTRDELRVLIKTVVKKIGVQFDPKVHVTMSIGVSKYPDNGTDFESLFAKADQAVYIAKEKGKNRHIIYEEALHGHLTKEEGLHNSSMTYALSKEKRRQILTKLLLGISTEGAGYVTDSKRVQDEIRTLADVDGMTIVTQEGDSTLVRCGNYVMKGHELSTLLHSDPYLSQFNEEGVLVENNYERLKVSYPKAYEIMQKQEVGASVMCVGYKDGKAYSLVTFDVFNRKRKWADADIDILQVIGCMLMDKLCK